MVDTDTSIVLLLFAYAVVELLLRKRTAPAVQGPPLPPQDPQVDENLRRLLGAMCDTTWRVFDLTTISAGHRPYPSGLLSMASFSVEEVKVHRAFEALRETARNRPWIVAGIIRLQMSRCWRQLDQLLAEDREGPAGPRDFLYQITSFASRTFLDVDSLPTLEIETEYLLRQFAYLDEHLRRCDVRLKLKTMRGDYQEFLSVP